MNAEELRALQKPFKDQYRNAPEAALLTLRAKGRLGEGLTCKELTERYCVVYQTLRQPPEILVG